MYQYIIWVLLFICIACESDTDKKSDRQSIKGPEAIINLSFDDDVKNDLIAKIKEADLAFFRASAEFITTVRPPKTTQEAMEITELKTCPECADEESIISFNGEPFEEDRKFIKEQVQDEYNRTLNNITNEKSIKANLSKLSEKYIQVVLADRGRANYKLFPVLINKNKSLLNQYNADIAKTVKGFRDKHVGTNVTKGTNDTNPHNDNYKKFIWAFFLGVVVMGLAVWGWWFRFFRRQIKTPQNEPQNPENTDKVTSSKEWLSQQEFLKKYQELYDRIDGVSKSTNNQLTQVRQNLSDLKEETSDLTNKIRKYNTLNENKGPVEKRGAYVPPKPTYNRPLFYARTVDVGDGFSVESLSEKLDRDTVFEIKQTAPTEAEFKVVDSEEQQRLALQDTYSYLQDACDYVLPTSTTNRIRTDREGMLVLHGNKWVITTKAKISFT